MLAQKHGRIINVGSLGGIVPMPFETLYSAAKFAVRGFTLSLQEELRGTGVSVSLISVGSVRTNMLDAEARDDHSTISFVNRPLDPLRVATAVWSNILKPKREVILPAVTGRLSFLLNMFSGLRSLAWPVLNFVGRRNLTRYRSALHLQSSVQFSGRIP